MAGEFERDLEAFKARVLRRETEVTKEVAALALRSLVDKTHVNTGRSRGNWRVRLYRPSTGVIKRRDKTGAVTLRAGMRVISKVKAHTSVYISNNWYIARFMDRGTIRQRPVHMVVRTLRLIDSSMGRVVARARKRVP